MPKTKTIVAAKVLATKFLTAQRIQDVIFSNEDEDEAFEEFGAAAVVARPKDFEGLKKAWKLTNAEAEKLREAYSVSISSKLAAQKNLADFIEGGLKVVTRQLKPLSSTVQRVVLGVEASGRPDLLDIWRVYHLEEIPQHTYRVQWGIFGVTDMAHWVRLDVDLYSPIQNSFRLLFELPYQVFLLDELSKTDALQVQFLPQPIETALLIKCKGKDIQTILQNYQEHL